jgi:hypothetical protein
MTLNEFPQLHLGCWWVDPTAELTDEEVFSLYKRQWKYMSYQDMEPHEKTLFHRLVNELGGGVLVSSPRSNELEEVLFTLNDH